MLNLYSQLNFPFNNLKYKTYIPTNFKLYTFIDNEYFNLDYKVIYKKNINIINNSLLSNSSIIFSNYRKIILNQKIFIGKIPSQGIIINLLLSREIFVLLKNNIDIKPCLTSNADVIIEIINFDRHLIQIKISNEKKNSPNEDIYLFFANLLKIPKKIYYTLPNKELLNQPITQSLLLYNKKISYNYSHIYYDDHQCLDFIKKNFDHNIYLSYCQIIPGAYKADFWRLCILYIYGGVYLDLGFKICIDMDKILQYNKLILVKDRFQKDIFNAFICCVPNHPFIKKCIDELCYKINNFEYGDSPLDFSGPIFIGKVLNEYEGKNDIFFLYHCQYGKNILTKENIKIIETKNGDCLFDTKYNKNKICAFRKEFNSSIKDEILSYHYDILWEQQKVFYNLYYGSWSKSAKDYHIKDGFLYCRLKNIAGDWIENRIKLSPFKKYCNKDGKLQEE
jgi:mannosyltransferase OCH1-like enzyme